MVFDNVGIQTSIASPVFIPGLNVHQMPAVRAVLGKNHSSSTTLRIIPWGWYVLHLRAWIIFNFFPHFQQSWEISVWNINKWVLQLGQRLCTWPGNRLIGERSRLPRGILGYLQSFGFICSALRLALASKASFLSDCLSSSKVDSMLQPKLTFYDPKWYAMPVFPIRQSSGYTQLDSTIVTNTKISFRVYA